MNQLSTCSLSKTLVGNAIRKHYPRRDWPDTLVAKQGRNNALAADNARNRRAARGGLLTAAWCVLVWKNAKQMASEK